jgi:diadenosine tetraphosphate (Ap4A) HIT family hydrolase
LRSISAFSFSRCAGAAPVEHRHRHLHPRQRRAQLVAGVGEQRPVRLHERLDALRRDVEARRDRGDLVAAA